jgi:hypothetical protein
MVERHGGGEVDFAWCSLWQGLIIVVVGVDACKAG